MSAKVYQAPKSSPASPQAQTTGADYPCSCPVGMLALFAGGAAWLAVALICSIRASLNFHAPKLLADISYLTYGRVQAAGSVCLLYGFCVPVVAGLGIWLLSRLGRTSVGAPGILTIGALLWHSAVAFAVLGILAGRSSGFEYFEVPQWGARLLLVSYLLIGLSALLTFHTRQNESVYPSQWFVLGAFFWFPWIFSTGMLTLEFFPSRGILQSITDWWYVRNFDTVFLGFGGLALTYYFIPKILNRPLASYYQAAFAFWTLALFGSCGGLPVGAPVPAWLIDLSLVGTLLLTVPVLAVVSNLYVTSKRDTTNLDSDPTLRFVYIGLIFWFIAQAQQIVSVIPSVSALVDFTRFGVSQKYLVHYGFFGLTAFGALYYAVPQMLGLERNAWCTKLQKSHFGLTFAGVLVTYLSLIITGLGEGLGLADGRKGFVEVMHSALIPFRFEIIGTMLVLLGTLAFILNFGNVLSKSVRRELKERGAL